VVLQRDDDDKWKEVANKRKTNIENDRDHTRLVAK
jgi:hypothetical protein